MLIPSDTAKPLNSFLNSGLTLKLSDSLSLSSALLSLLLSVRLLAKAAPFGAATVTPGRATRRNDTDFCLSCNPESQKSAYPESQKCRILDRETYPSIAHRRSPAPAKELPN